MVYDKREYVSLLNHDVYGEHEAIVYYLTHAWTVAYQYGPQIEQIAKDEMRHMKWLAHTIVALGGVPDLKAPGVSAPRDVRAALAQDVEAEKGAIAQYQLHQEMIADDRIRDLLGRIVVDEKDHLRQFSELLDQEQGQEWGSTRDPQTVQEVAQNLQRLVGQEYHEVLSYLLASFLHDHGHQIGMNFEERAVEEMRHLGWIAESLADLGHVPHLGGTGPGALEAGEAEEMAAYRKVRDWAQQQMPPLVPTIDRIMAHERYQGHVLRQAGGWTVGSLRE